MDQPGEGRVSDREEDDEDIDLVFHDMNKGPKTFRLVLEEYDGKGVFILRNKEKPDSNVVGLTRIVHYIRRRRHLLLPHTIRDIIRKYVEDVSIFEEESKDSKNLTTSDGIKVSMSDPPFKLYKYSKYNSVTLYLRNKNYLKGVQGKKDEETSSLSRTDWLIVGVCALLAMIIPYLIYWISVIDYEKNYKKKL